MKTLTHISRRRIYCRGDRTVALLIAVLLACFLVPAIASAQGLPLREGQAAPHEGLLFTKRDLASILAGEELKRELVRNGLQSRLNICNLELKTAWEASERWEALHDTQAQENAALRAKYIKVINHVNSWRFGLGLLIIKFPDNVRVE